MKVHFPALGQMGPTASVALGSLMPENCPTHGQNRQSHAPHGWNRRTQALHGQDLQTDRSYANCWPHWCWQWWGLQKACREGATLSFQGWERGGVQKIRFHTWKDRQGCCMGVATGTREGASLNWHPEGQLAEAIGGVLQRAAGR